MEKSSFLMPQNVSTVKNSSSNPSMLGTFQKTFKRQGTFGKTTQGNLKDILSIKKQTLPLFKNENKSKIDSGLDLADKF